MKRSHFVALTRVHQERKVTMVLVGKRLSAAARRVVLTALLTTACSEGPAEPASTPPKFVKVRICVAMTGEAPDRDGVEVQAAEVHSAVLRSGECFEFEKYLEGKVYPVTVWDVAPHCAVRGADSHEPLLFYSQLNFEGHNGATRVTVYLDCGPLPDVLEGTVQLDLERSPEEVGFSVDNGVTRWLQMTREPGLENARPSYCFETGPPTGSLLAEGEHQVVFVDFAGNPLAMYGQIQDPTEVRGGQSDIHYFSDARSLSVPVRYGKLTKVFAGVQGFACY